MVAKSCSRSQGQPPSGSRRRAITLSRRSIAARACRHHSSRLCVAGRPAAAAPGAAAAAAQGLDAAVVELELEQRPARAPARRCRPAGRCSSRTSAKPRASTPSIAEAREQAGQRAQPLAGIAQARAPTACCWRADELADQPLVARQPLAELVQAQPRRRAGRARRRARAAASGTGSAAARPGPQAAVGLGEQAPGEPQPGAEPRRGCSAGSARSAPQGVRQALGQIVEALARLADQAHRVGQAARQPHHPVAELPQLALHAVQQALVELAEALRQLGCAPARQARPRRSASARAGRRRGRSASCRSRGRPPRSAGSRSPPRRGPRPPR